MRVPRDSAPVVATGKQERGAVARVAAHVRAPEARPVARVDQVTAADVLAVLAPICGTKRETARRVRQRIGAVMKWAVANGYRETNPAGTGTTHLLNIWG